MLSFVCEFNFPVCICYIQNSILVEKVVVKKQVKNDVFSGITTFAICNIYRGNGRLLGLKGLRKNNKGRPEMKRQKPCKTWKLNI